MATQTAGTGDSGNSSHSLLALEEFRRGFEYFLLTFHIGGTSGGGYVYKDQIRTLALQPFLSSRSDALLNEAESNDFIEASNDACPLVVLNMEHLKMPHWLPGSRREREGMEVTDWESPEDSELRRSCEKLYECLKHLPFKYIAAAELVVRDVFVLLEVASAQVLKITDTAGQSIGDMVEDALVAGVDKVIQLIPEAIHLRQRLAPFQIELNCREAPRPIRELKSTLIERLVVVPGIVIQASRPFLKASLIVIQCRDCSHRKVLKVPLWKQGTALPRTCEARQDPNAEKCSLDPFVVVAEECHYVDVQTVKLQELPDDVPTGDIPRHLTLNVTGALVNRASAGTRLLACGVYSAYDRSGAGRNAGGGLESAVRSGYLHVLGIEPLSRDTVKGFSRAPTSLIMSSGAGFTLQEVEQFHRLAALPDIIDQVTASIAPSIYGLQDIKRSVACMLFGGSRKYLADGSSLRGDIHLLLLGDPSTAKSQVLKFVEKSAPVAIYTSGKGSSAAGLTAALIRDNQGNYALEGGAMVLADSGVVCIDEFDKMRDDDRVAIHEAMEQQTISIAKAGVNTVLTTQCAVLAAANPTFGCYDDTKDASEQHNFEATILSRFDCIWLVRDERDVEKDRILAQHIFSMYTGNKSGTGAGAIGEGPIPLHTLRNFICYCRANCHPRLSAEAAKRLENFYVEVREKNRSERRTNKSRDQIPITVRQLESLARLSESFAKMSLSQYATMAHVEEAIRLFRVSTVATAQSSVGRMAALGSMSAEERELVKSAEEALLQRLAIGGRAAKTTIVRDLRVRGFEGGIIAKALSVLIQRGVLEERGDATVRRV